MCKTALKRPFTLVRLFAIIERATAVNPDAHWPLADGQFPGHKKSPGREAPGALREKQ